MRLFTFLRNAPLRIRTIATIIHRDQDAKHGAADWNRDGAIVKPQAPAFWYLHGR
jgi:hypothetical protein